MTGKRYLAVLLIILMVMVSACSKEQEIKTNSGQDATPATTNQSTPGASNPAENSVNNSGDTQEQVFTQEKKVLPDAAFLSTYPGVLKTMSLTLEEIISVLGTNFELFENSVQGYDVYQFSDYNLVIEYDRINEKFSTIWLDDVPYYVYSGAFRSFDLDNDGKEEEIAAYEDENFNGRVTVFGKDGVIKADQTTEYFDGKCNMSFISGYGQEKESLIILDTRAERECEVFSYTNGKLISMLPPNQEDIASQATVEIKERTVFLALAESGTSYECPIPDYLWQAYVNDTGALPDYNFSMNVKPVITDNSLSLLIRHSLQLKLYEDTNVEEGTAIYSDVAQVINEFQYLGSGKWQFLASKGGPKYDKSNMAQGVNKNDFRVGAIDLLSPVHDISGHFSADFSQYSEYDLMSGVLVKSEGLCLGITNMQVSYISLEKNSSQETARGLKVLDTKQQALALYGLPDKGYFEDAIWTYYFLREENREEGSYSLIDSFNIEFDGDVVSKIWMAMYEPVY